MRILLLTTKVPFIQGGAQAHTEGLRQALLQAGHDVDILEVPFKFEDYEHLDLLMNFVSKLNVQMFNGYRVDGVISLLFPMFGVSHPKHVNWIIHQLRTAYDLADTEASQFTEDQLGRIRAFDSESMSQSQAVFANSQNVANRLQKYNQISSKALYHPPPHAHRFFCRKSLPYVYYPSRLEPLKRHKLFLQAAALTSSPMKFIVSGTGSQAEFLAHEVERLNLQEKVKMLGQVSEEEKLLLYSQCAAVFFGPLDEDLGYVTLEAMLSSKPVITCSDSGGPLEFIDNEINGWVIAPEPEELASVIDKIYSDPEMAQAMGERALSSYSSKNISWSNVVETLISAMHRNEH